MTRMLIAAALLAAAALPATAGRTRPVAVDPAAAELAASLSDLELPAAGKIVCAFPDADGGCSGAITFVYEDRRPALTRPETPARPAPSSRESRRPASGD